MVCKFRILPIHTDVATHAFSTHAGVRAKPVAHLMQYHLLQWEIAKVKQLMNSNITLTVLNLHQMTPKGTKTK